MSSNTVVIKNLNAVITPRFNAKKKIEGCHVYIVLKGPNGNIGVASAILGGKWNETQALREFRIAQKRFSLIENGMNIAKTLNLV